MRATHVWSLAVVLAQLLLLALPAAGFAPPLGLFALLAFCVTGYGVSLARDWRHERAREVDTEAAHAAHAHARSYAPEGREKAAEKEMGHTEKAGALLPA